MAGRDTERLEWAPVLLSDDILTQYAGGDINGFVGPVVGMDYLAGRAIAVQIFDRQAQLRSAEA